MTKSKPSKTALTTAAGIDAMPLPEVVEDVDWAEWEDSVLQHDTQFFADEMLRELAEQLASQEAAAAQPAPRP
jgi:hypothetical protein